MNGSPHCLLATVESDSHMWNLVYLQLWLTEHGFNVKNLGSCTPTELVLTSLEQHRTQLLVVSSVNGHGHSQGLELIRLVRQHHPDLPCVIGGKLTTSEDQTRAVSQELLAAGYNQVFIGDDAISTFEIYLGTLDRKKPALVLGTGTAPCWT
ncbi:cobalamin B12-binding domain-containing protein [Pseudomonas gingeri]|uniref:Cobalamin B12-binding domain-containing protein n=1 Tax=Pseudomonas gingeri TaxID=117681 RepID=A0A7Y8C543_9PSED|nr:cobalamin-dependent protein [Pseudomonas gingeri]NWB99001.1 cobalamin B12-binding domain-containing protein [Pseudomonas gingeri]